MKQTFIILFTFLTIQLGAKISPEIYSIVQNIAQYNQLESENVGISGETTIQYRNFIKLRDNATIDELLELLKHENSVVKGYSSWALADRMYPRLVDIFDEFMVNGYSAKAQNGCIVSNENLAKELYYRVVNQHFHNKLSVNDSLFFQIQIQKLDSVILYGSNDGYLVHRVLSTNHSNSKNYDRIRYLAATNKRDYYLVALAEYQNPDDISFLMQQDRNAFLAISVFPNPKFWNFLLGYSSKEKSLNYFLAVSSFKNSSALELLNELYKSCNSEQINNLDKALIKNYCKLYQDLILKIWENNKTIDYTITQSLITDCPEKASLSFSRGLLNDCEFNFLELDSNYGTKGSILQLMIENIINYNPSLLNEICIKNIKDSKFMELSTILNVVEQRQITKATQAILERLNKRNYPFEIFQLTETLLSFDNTEANMQLVEILKSKRNDWDEGNWSEGFRKLFKENNLEIE